MKDNKIVIWDLFGGSIGSLSRAIKSKKYEIYTIDILEKTIYGKDNIVIDLSGDIKTIIKELEKLPKPNIIVGSPICTSWSRLTSVKGGNRNWIINKQGGISKRPKTHFTNIDIMGNKNGQLRYKYDKVPQSQKLGISTIENTISIIEHFKPKYWYIENPQTSLIWNYIEVNLKFDKGVKNITHYGSYGHWSKKPTTFLSNIKLDLKKVDNNYKSYTTKYLHWDKVPKKERSLIPPKLLKEIISQFK